VAEINVQTGNTTDQQPAYYVGTLVDVGQVLYRTTTARVDQHPYPVVTRCELDHRDPALWPVVAGVFTASPYTVERMARAMADLAGDDWHKIPAASRDWWRDLARAANAATMPAQCSTCGRIMPTDEAAAGFTECEHCPRSRSGAEVAR
jgi:hypothetical protein